MLAFPHNSLMLAALFFVVPKPRPEEKELRPILRPPLPTPPCTAGAAKQALKHFRGNVTMAAQSLGVNRAEFFEFVRASNELYSVITDARKAMADAAEKVIREAVQEQKEWAVNDVIKDCEKDPPAEGSPRAELYQMALDAKAHIDARKKAKELRERHEQLQREAQLAAEAALAAETAQATEAPEPAPAPSAAPESAPTKTLKQMEEEEARLGLEYEYPAEYLIQHHLTWVLNTAERLRKTPSLMERLLEDLRHWAHDIYCRINKKLDEEDPRMVQFVLTKLGASRGYVLPDPPPKPPRGGKGKGAEPNPKPPPESPKKPDVSDEDWALACRLIGLPPPETMRAETTRGGGSGQSSEREGKPPSAPSKDGTLTSSATGRCSQSQVIVPSAENAPQAGPDRGGGFAKHETERQRAEPREGPGYVDRVPLCEAHNPAPHGARLAVTAPANDAALRNVPPAEATPVGVLPSGGLRKRPAYAGTPTRTFSTMFTWLPQASGERQGPASPMTVSNAVAQKNDRPTEPSAEIPASGTQSPPDFANRLRNLTGAPNEEAFQPDQSGSNSSPERAPVGRTVNDHE